MKKTKLGSVLFLSAITCLVFGGIFGYLMPEQPLIKQIFGGVFLIGIIGYFIVERKQFAQSLGKKTTQYGLVSVVSAVMALAILVVVNCISANYDVKKDLTKNKLHTLSEQSVKIIKNLKSEVTLRLFVAPNQMHEFDGVLNKYTYHTNMVKRDFIDVDKDPLILQKYNIKDRKSTRLNSSH